jgi:hypothetical protein
MVIIYALIAFIAGIGLAGLYFHIHSLNQRISRLEESQAKHLPYKTAEEIEDGIAALLTLKFHSDVRSDFIDNALAHLQKARGGNAKEK